MSDPAGSLFEGKLTYDTTYGHVTYGCANCCGYYTPSLTFNPLGIPFGGGSGNGVGAYSSCGGGLLNVSSSFYNNWSTAAPSIATVNATGYHTAVQMGSTTSATSGNLPLGGQRFSCPLHNFGPTGGDNVGPNKVEPISTTLQGSAICPIGQHGWSRNVTNQVEYVNGSAYKVAGVNMADSVSVGTRNDFGIISVQTGTASTDSSGTFPDTYYVCSTVCPNTVAESDALQRWTYNQMQLAHINTIVYKCSSISVDGF